MASTKSATAVRNSYTLVKDQAEFAQTSSAVDLTDGYGAVISIKVTNGGTAPTLPAKVRIQTSEDNSEWYNFGGAFVANLGNSVVTSWGSNEIPMGTQYVRTQSGGNTDQDVTLDIDVSEVTAVQ